jgi:hypothetical protein
LLPAHLSPPAPSLCPPARLPSPQYAEQSKAAAAALAASAAKDAELAALRRVEEEHRALLAQAGAASRNDSALAELRESHKEKVASVRESAEAALQRATQSAMVQMAELQRAHALELEQTRIDWERHTAENTKRHGEEVARLRAIVDAAEAVRFAGAARRGAARRAGD